MLIDGQKKYCELKSDFQKKIENNEFAEFSEVYDYYYGVLLEEIRNSMSKNKISLLVINWEGFQI